MAKDNSLEGQLLAIADKIDLLYESFEEISKSNPDKVFKEMFREAVLTVKAFLHRPCVTYFFEAIFPELLNADFLWQDCLSRRNRGFGGKITKTKKRKIKK